MRNYFKGAIFISMALLSWLGSIVIINIFVGVDDEDGDDYSKPLMICYYEMSIFMVLFLPTII